MMPDEVLVMTRPHLPHAGHEAARNRDHRNDHLAEMLLPGIERSFQGKGRRRAAGIVYEDVDRSELVLDLEDFGIEDGKLREIPVQRQKPPAGEFLGGAQLIQCGTVDVGTGHAAAFTSQRGCYGCSEAATGSHDQRHLAVDLKIHVGSAICRIARTVTTKVEAPADRLYPATSLTSP
jgi:hypothetical protein